ncbi:TetR/AcrR family transcriptional regulator [Streptomyces sp. BA2]|uniref:TetR/AcrR family transcriptional regulator n=1 Tax=Streptomyces sp. BA2 TaxID=436595 RepID=UPI001326C656|nr:TetR/AcrR family transcriptional regulator [Streptomyces sp. BA2]MWA08414.1 TetR family transcriptional regulator [Streptomyces sp. BA2]
MPIEVDAAHRLDEIAAATIEVARERGVRAVTIRAVAERLGGSTAVVTNYVPSRADLMVNALRHAEREWAREADGLLSGVQGIERLSALARWMCSTVDDDEVMRRLLMEIIAAGPAAGREAEQVRELARDQREELQGVVTEADVPGPDLAADVLHLLFRGYWLSALEDPEGWPAERGERAAQAVVEMLRDGASAKDTSGRASGS